MQCPEDVRKAYARFMERLRELEADPDLSPEQRAQLSNYIQRMANKDSARAMWLGLNRALLELSLLYHTGGTENFNYSAQLRSYADEMNDYMLHPHEKGSVCLNCAPQETKDRMMQQLECDVTVSENLPFMAHRIC